MSPIYCALVEIEPIDGCELDPSEIAGAAVRCYIPADNSRRALQLLESELENLKMKLVETEWCVDYDATDWQNPDCDTEEELVSEARLAGSIVFGSFHTWGHDASECHADAS